MVMWNCSTQAIKNCCLYHNSMISHASQTSSILAPIVLMQNLWWLVVNFPVQSSQYLSSVRIKRQYRSLLELMILWQRNQSVVTPAWLKILSSLKNSVAALLLSMIQIWELRSGKLTRRNGPMEGQNFLWELDQKGKRLILHKSNQLWLWNAKMECNH